MSWEKDGNQDDCLSCKIKRREIFHNRLNNNNNISSSSIVRVNLYGFNCVYTQFTPRIVEHENLKPTVEKILLNCLFDFYRGCVKKIKLNMNHNSVYSYNLSLEKRARETRYFCHKAALWRSFYECVYCIWLSFQRNYLG